MTGAGGVLIRVPNSNIGALVRNSRECLRRRWPSNGFAGNSRKRMGRLTVTQGALGMRAKRHTAAGLGHTSADAHTVNMKVAETSIEA